jgi:hypothetical protein
MSTCNFYIHSKGEIVSEKLKPKVWNFYSKFVCLAGLHYEIGHDVLEYDLLQFCCAFSNLLCVSHIFISLFSFLKEK